MRITLLVTHTSEWCYKEKQDNAPNAFAESSKKAQELEYNAFLNLKNVLIKFFDRAKLIDKAFLTLY